MLETSAKINLKEVKNRMRELVTVIIPVYNTKRRYLDKCVQSVMRQTFRNFSVLLINDSSTDSETIECLAEIEKLYPTQIKVTHLERNGGISSSRNYGIEHANGKWICFLDHDDYWESNYLEEMLAAASSEDTEIVVSGFKTVDENDKVCGCFPQKERRFFSEYFPYSTAAPWNRLIRRQLLIEQNIRYPDGCWVEDIPFNILCNISARKIVVADIYGYCNRINPSSASRSEAFERMAFNSMPFQMLGQIYTVNCKDEQRRKMRDGAIMEVMTLLSCLFCRRSPLETVKKAAAASAILARGNIRHYIVASFRFAFHVDSRISVKVIQLGFAVAIFLRIEKIYCVLISNILSVIA